MSSSKSLVLFDTNILIYAHNKEAKYFDTALDLLKKVQKGELKGAVAHQNLLEFYAVITNPDRMERPLTQDQAKKEVQNYLESRFEIIQPNRKTLNVFMKLLKARRVKDREVFDCYLVATMLANSISTVYTANDKDFRKYRGIKAVNPFEK